MTQEQWVIYLYGIYPNGGYTFIYGGLLLCWLGLLFAFFIFYQMEREFTSEEKLKKFSWVSMTTKTKVIPIIILGTLLFLSNLIPSKNTFLLLVATPTVVELVKESATDGKLKKMDTILDKALNKLEKELE